MPIELIEDGRDYFMKNKNVIYVQPVEGKPDDRIPYCYGCGSKVKHETVTYPAWVDQQGSRHDRLFAMDGRVKSRFVMYCPQCEPEMNKQ